MLLTNRPGQPQVGETLSAAVSTADRVWVVSAYISPDGCEKIGLLESAGRAVVCVALGRATAEGLPRETLAYLSRVHAAASARGGGIRAASPACHSKLYVVEGRTGVRAWIGSSNLTNNGMGNWPETNLEVTETFVDMLLTEARAIWTSGLPLGEVREKEILRPLAARPGSVEARRVPVEEPGAPEGAPSLSLSLLTSRTRDVALGSGLNWWHGGGRARKPNEACVALPVSALADAALVFGSSLSGTKFPCHLP